MKSRGSILLPLVLGLSDGILNALTLAGGRLIRGGAGLEVGLALRVAAVAFVTGAFVFFVARYAELREELAHAERQLILRTRGRLAASHLGSAVRREAVAAAAISGTSSFLGAAIPLAAGLLLPAERWASIVVALASLSALGVVLARVVYGSMVLWAAGLLFSGGLLTVLGILLHIT